MVTCSRDSTHECRRTFGRGQPIHIITFRPESSEKFQSFTSLQRAWPDSWPAKHLIMNVQASQRIFARLRRRPLVRQAKPGGKEPGGERISFISVCGRHGSHGRGVEGRRETPYSFVASLASAISRRVQTEGRRGSHYSFMSFCSFLNFDFSSSVASAISLVS